MALHKYSICTWFVLWVVIPICRYDYSAPVSSKSYRVYTVLFICFKIIKTISCWQNNTLQQLFSLTIDIGFGNCIIRNIKVKFEHLIGVLHINLQNLLLQSDKLLLNCNIPPIWYQVPTIPFNSIEYGRLGLGLKLGREGCDVMCSWNIDFISFVCHAVINRTFLPTQPHHVEDLWIWNNYSKVIGIIV